MIDGYVRRTAITRLSIDGKQRDLLEATITEYKRGCQLATDMAWGKCNAKSDVQSLAYRKQGERPPLQSGMNPTLDRNGYLVGSDTIDIDGHDPVSTRERLSEQVRKVPLSEPSIAIDNATPESTLKQRGG